MEILNKKVSMEIWKFLAFMIVVVGFGVLGIATDNIMLSNNFIIVAKIITVIIVGTIVAIKIVKLLLNKIDSIKEFVTNHINYIIIGLIAVLVAILIFGIVHQINIGAMSESVLKTIAIIGVIIISILLIVDLLNIIRLSIAYKKIKKKTKMKRLASLVMKSNMTINNSSNRKIIIKALVTDLYGSLSVQDIIAEENIETKKLYKSETFLSLINNIITVSQELGGFQASFDLLVKNRYISAMEAATAKVVSFSIDRDILELL